MNTETFTTPSPELKKHAQDLRRDVGLVTKDVKNQTAAGLEEVKSEAASRLRDARGTAGDLFDSVRNFAVEHPFSFFGFGLITGVLLATWRRK